MACVQELLGEASDLPGEDRRREAEMLLGHCLGKSRAWLYTWPDSEVAPEQAQTYRKLLKRRLDGVPIAYLTGTREFWSMDLAVSQDTLIPRPETETLVEWALALPVPVAAEVLDLGTGSGAIALAVATERPGWQITAVDHSASALAVAKANAGRNGLDRIRFLASDWYQSLAGQRFHLLLSNPPYIAPDDHHLELGDLRYEPRQALVARQQGLADLVSLVAGAPDHLQPEGWILLEHGWEQGAAVRELLHERGFCEVETRPDIAGRERVSGGRWCAD